jgi:major type 1 subunit fimbrin (pilin)
LEENMMIRIKRAMVVAGITAGMALPMSGLASDGTITFSGAVTASTCSLSVNGGGATATVTLPTVDTAALTGTSPKTTAAGTFFSIAVGTCTTQVDIGLPTAAAPTQVQIYFEAGPSVDQATGGLINHTGTGYSNVEVMLYNASGSTVVGTQIQPGTGTNQPAVLTVSGGTQWFYAGYSTTGAGVSGATAGAVSTTVTYSLIYS